jgi:hypothetical protein
MKFSRQQKMLPKPGSACFVIRYIRKAEICGSALPVGLHPTVSSDRLRLMMQGLPFVPSAVVV